MQFRCPYEERAKEEGSIIEVTLSEERSERLNSIRDALIQFYNRIKSPAIRFLLPNSLRQKCTSNEEVKKQLYPFQSEILATELDIRLHPLLPYHTPTQIETKQKFNANSLNKEWAARILNGVMRMGGVPAPKNVAEVGIWIEVHFSVAYDGGIQNPLLEYIDYVGGKKITLITITPGGLIIHGDRGLNEEDPGNVHNNHNCFSIVKTPFYPKTFGRWSETIEIVLSREADFANLSNKVRRNIRKRSNLVLKQGGVKIRNLEKDKQSTGVWVPEFLTSNIETKK